MFSLARWSAVGAIAAVWGTGWAKGETRFVRASALGEGDGSSWTNAFTTLQAALAVAQPGDEVWVALGTYPVPDNAGFIGPAGVSLYGGFSGVESSIAERPIGLRTRLTGFHPARGVIVLTLTGAAPGTVVDGFLLDGTLTHDHEGGGLAVLGGSATIRNCTFFDNIAGCGAAAFVSNADVTFEDSLFQHNWSQVGHGGAIKTIGVGSLTVTNCQFIDNLCRELDGVPGSGGGIYNGAGSVLRVARCLFDDNWAYNLGHEFVTIGGGVANESANARIENSIFIRNEASLGGGIGSTAPLTVVNCLISGNRASEPANNTPFRTGEGGGIYGDEDVNLTVKSCTVAANWSKHTAAGAAMDGSFENCILWYNVALVEPGDNPEALIDQQYKGDVEIRYSDIAGLLDGGGPDPQFPGSFESNPLFVSAPSLSNNGVFVAGDLHLESGSTCLDAGDNAAIPAGVTTDLDGLSRRFDDRGAPNVGLGSPPHVDIGCFERQAPPCPGDLNGDHAVDIGDLAILLANFGTQSGATLEDGDLDGDSDVDLSDLTALLSAFGNACR